MKLTVTTYNILHGEAVGYDWARLADVIRSSGADIVGLQEVDRCTHRTGGRDATCRLLENMGWSNGHFSLAMPFDGGEYGIAFMSRFPSAGAHPYTDMPLPYRVGQEPRVCMHTVLMLPAGAGQPDKRLHFLNTHLAYEDPVCRLPQVRALQEHLERIPTGEPFILTGDFNTETYSELAPLLNGRAAWANELEPGHSADRHFKTFREPPMAIDNILYDASLLTLEACGMRVGAESDHNLFWATLTLADA